LRKNPLFFTLANSKLKTIGELGSGFFNLTDYFSDIGVVRHIVQGSYTPLSSDMLLILKTSQTKYAINSQIDPVHLDSISKRLVENTSQYMNIKYSLYSKAMDDILMKNPNAFGECGISKEEFDLFRSKLYYLPEHYKRFALTGEDIFVMYNNSKVFFDEFKDFTLIWKSLYAPFELPPSKK